MKSKSNEPLTTEKFTCVLKLVYIENCIRSAIRFIGNDSPMKDKDVEAAIVDARYELEMMLISVIKKKNQIKGEPE